MKRWYAIAPALLMLLAPVDAKPAADSAGAASSTNAKPEPKSAPTSDS